MISSIVTASVLSSPRTAIARLSPMRSTSTPQLSKIRANGKSYAVSIVIGCRAAFIRARSGTRTFSCVMFSLKRSGCAHQKEIGAAAHRQPRIGANSNERALESLGVPVQTSDPGASRQRNLMSSQHRLAGKDSSTDCFNYIEKAGGRVKDEISWWWTARRRSSPASSAGPVCRRAARSDKRLRRAAGRGCGPGSRGSWSRASRRRR